MALVSPQHAVVSLALAFGNVCSPPAAAADNAYAGAVRLPASEMEGEVHF